MLLEGRKARSEDGGLDSLQTNIRSGVVALLEELLLRTLN